MNPSPDTQDTEELKPCPFCGACAAALDRDLWWKVSCARCGSSTGKRLASLNTRDEAIAAWNTRPDSPVTVNGLVETLKLVRKIAEPLIQLDDVWEDATHIVSAIDHALAKLSQGSVDE